MKRLILIISLFTMALGQNIMNAQDFQKIPVSWKWLSNKEVAFSYDGRFESSEDFIVSVPSKRSTKGVNAPAKYAAPPITPQGAVNLSFSPDSTKLAFTRDNDLYIVDIATKEETRLTTDGTDLILNGYASWVYYEEILGRSSRYKAFWWSPDSKKIGFYRFDNTQVPMFPIYSAKGQDGSLNLTRYPKAGETNPKVKIGIVDISTKDIVWADFDDNPDQYFGIPFWGADSQEFFIAREPRVQNTIDLYSVSIKDGSKKHIYHETYPTWVDWFEGVQFTQKGLYMVRAFETGWEQIYFLSYDGKEFKRLSEGNNWNTSIVKVDEAKGDIYFIANRDSPVRKTLYRLNKKGEISALTDTDYTVSAVRFSPDNKYFVHARSNFKNPNQIWLVETAKPSKATLIADEKGPDFNIENFVVPELITIKAEDGQEMPAAITYPRNFDPTKKYPVHMEIYGGPNTQYVSESWKNPNAYTWWSDNEIITIVADCRASGHTGRAGTDLIHKNLTEAPVKDFATWAEYLKSLPYVDGDRIGVEGFSFGGTMTSMLLMRHSDLFCCGIAGGGVYDWMLYDSHYTERFMDTPQNNPEGYKASSPINYVLEYPVNVSDAPGKIMLKLTHGTGDDNVHFQNTLQLVDALQQNMKKFELMIYPDGMHGYRGTQGAHSDFSDKEFWTKYLLR